MIKSEVKNPWLGLKSYPEGRKIYGRDKEIVELSQKIMYNTQTIIYGKSGIGKSSILNAGVFPVLRRNNYFPVYVRLVHDGKVSYCSQIISAVRNSLKRLRVEDLGAPEGAIYKDVEGFETEVVKRYDDKIPEGLWEFFHRHEFGYKLNEEDAQHIAPVLIFDQFEEMFTLQKDNEKVIAFFDELASLLNNICPEYLLHSTVEVSDRPVDSVPKGSLIRKGLVKKSVRLDYIDETNMRVVISLREDYLSYLERNIMHIPSMKHNRYCLRPLSEDQAGEIIMKPVPGLIDLDVAEAIICKVTGETPDAFVVGDDKPQIEVDSAMLSLFLTELYEKKPQEQTCLTKEMVKSHGEKIIPGFYAKITSSIPEKVVHFMEDNLLTDDGRRDNIPLSKARSVISPETFKYLKEERFIHVFPWNNEMRIEYMHDILCKTIEKSRDARHERVMMEKKEQEIKSMRRKNRITIFSVVLLVMVIAVYYLCAMVPVTQRYASTAKVFGQFRGVERLTRKEASYRPYHFVFKKKGLATKIYSSMECRNGYDTLTTLHSMKPYIISGSISDSGEILNGDIASALSTVCQWEFVTDVEGEKVIQERAYDSQYNLVYAFNYNAISVPQGKSNLSADKKSSEEDRVVSDRVVIGSYVDDQGLPLEMLKDGYRFVRITYDNAGHDALVEYFDNAGLPATNTDGAYQAYYEYNEEGQRVSMSSLNKYGKRMIDRAGNCGMVFTYDGYRQIEALSVDEFGREAPVEEGYSRLQYKYDEHGREVEVTLWCLDEPFSSEDVFHRKVTIYEDDAATALMYDAEDILVSREYVRYNDKGQILAYEYEHDGNHTSVSNRYSDDGRLIYNKEVNVEASDTLGVYTFERIADTEIRKYEGEKYFNYVNFTSYDAKGRMIEDVCYELDGVTPYEDDYRYHRETHSYIDDTRKSSSIFKEEIDTAVYYNVDGLSKIVVNTRYPNRNTSTIERFDPDTTLKEYQTQLEDVYGNRIEEVQGDLKVYNLINARTHRQTGESVAFLTTYGFPTDQFDLYTNVGNSYETETIDENAERVDGSYVLPDVYGGVRERPVVFIEIIENGRKFFGVILESDSGVRYGEDNYDFNNFNQDDDIIYLNLTTMRVGEMSMASDVIYWTIYNRKVTEEEYQIYQDHYDAYRAKDDVNVIYASASGEGYMGENGYSGDYFVLKWCDWDCTQPASDFYSVVTKTKDMPKDVIMLPFELKDDEIIFGDLLVLDDVEGLVGVYYDTFHIRESSYEAWLLSRYNDYMNSNN